MCKYLLLLISLEGRSGLIHAPGVGKVAVLVLDEFLTYVLG